MEGKRTKVRVIHPIGIPDVAPPGFETELVSILTDEDEVVPDKYVFYTDKKGFTIGQRKIAPSYTIPKGTFIGFRFVGANGETYRYEDTITRQYGYRPIAEFFEKIK